MTEQFTPDDARTEAVTRFIAERNGKPQYHIGYLSTDLAGVLHDLDELVSGWSVIVAAVDDGTIVGVLGFDADPEIGRTWLYGPFATDEQWDEIVAMLWNAVNPLILEAVREVEIYCNVVNRRVIDFARTLGLADFKDAVILEVKRETAMRQPEPVGVTFLAPMHHDAFVALHETTFPNTYYTGSQILERVAESEDRRVFVIVEGETLLGYAHVEALPDLGEASVEFVGVLPKARGKGVGTRLLRAALRWIFSYPRIDVLSLTTETDNEVALRLYRNAGFEVIHEMRSFRSRN